jgi:4a-hydroxytetrahydrobiopterin dehydratase
MWMEGAMNDLAGRTCEACRVGAPAVTEREIGELMPRIPAWRIEQEQGIDRLVRTFQFADFAAALAFTNRVGALAEAEGHHPAILTEWGRVRVCWWTHKIKGLHVNDFIMAAKTDALVD